MSNIIDITNGLVSTCSSGHLVIKDITGENNIDKDITTSCFSRQYDPGTVVTFTYNTTENGKVSSKTITETIYQEQMYFDGYEINTTDDIIEITFGMHFGTVNYIPPVDENYKLSNFYLLANIRGNCAYNIGEVITCDIIQSDPDNQNEYFDAVFRIKNDPAISNRFNFAIAKKENNSISIVGDTITRDDTIERDKLDKEKLVGEDGDTTNYKSWFCIDIGDGGVENVTPQIESSTIDIYEYSDIQLLSYCAQISNSDNYKTKYIEYYSYDGGKTWTKDQIATYGGIILCRYTYLGAVQESNDLTQQTKYNNNNYFENFKEYDVFDEEDLDILINKVSKDVTLEDIAITSGIIIQYNTITFQSIYDLYLGNTNQTIYDSIEYIVRVYSDDTTYKEYKSTGDNPQVLKDEYGTHYISCDLVEEGNKITAQCNIIIKGIESTSSEQVMYASFTFNQLTAPSIFQNLTSFTISTVDNENYVNIKYKKIIQTEWYDYNNVLIFTDDNVLCAKAVYNKFYSDITTLSYKTSDIKIINYNDHYTNATGAIDRDKIKRSKPKSYIQIIYNDSYEKIKSLDSISYILNEFNDNMNKKVDGLPMRIAEEDHSKPLKDYKVRVYNESTESDYVDLTQAKINDIDNYKVPHYEKGIWNFNYFRNTLDTNGYTDSDNKSVIYGKYFVVDFIFNNNSRVKLENVSFNVKPY